MDCLSIIFFWHKSDSELISTFRTLGKRIVGVHHVKSSSFSQFNTHSTKTISRLEVYNRNPHSFSSSFHRWGEGEEVPHLNILKKEADPRVL
jgi:hypothetical protein